MSDGKEILFVNKKNILEAQREMYFLLFGDECPVEGNSISDLDSAIVDCEAMVRYSIDSNNKEELSYWRKLLQENKVLRRQMKSD